MPMWVRALGILDSEFTGPCMEMIAQLSHDVEDVGLAAVQTLASAGRADLLSSFMRSLAASVRKAAVVEVGRHSQVGKSCECKISVWADALTCPISLPSCRALKARKHQTAVLVDLLADTDVTVRSAAVHALGELREDTDETCLVSLAALHSTERQARIRKAAVQALGKAEGTTQRVLTFFQNAPEPWMLLQTILHVLFRRRPRRAVSCRFLF